MLRDGDGRVVALYVNGEEVAREPLPDGDYRLAVGGYAGYVAFEVVDAAAAAAFWVPIDWTAGVLEWRPQVHKHLSPATRARAVALMRLGHLLSLQRVDEEQWALREVWREVVLPQALRLW